MMSIFFLVALWFAVAVTAAILAGNKGRSGPLWFAACLLLSPLAILPLLALRSLARAPHRDTVPRADGAAARFLNDDPGHR